jgi:hypothetical protein
MWNLKTQRVRSGVPTALISIDETVTHTLGAVRQGYQQTAPPDCGIPINVTAHCSLWRGVRIVMRHAPTQKIEPNSQMISDGDESCQKNHGTASPERSLRSISDDGGRVVT